MTDVEERLARRVAEAADAWLRDPLDAGVYRRLVAATLAWRSRTVPDDGPVAAGVDAPPRPVGDARDGDRERREGREGPGVTAPLDDERYLRPDRAPRPVGSALADVASLLRARSAAAQGETVRRDAAPEDAARVDADPSED
ncbi:hypothetical protein V5D56_04370 [Cellulosimicrobium sp. PMB13]|uniref:hypothetical protein n=1 Tax=Cellulosimicrobium sp. PMB13 TaxID=3120158 RepID=UPI003F4B3CED